jgi:hypothetical protein
VVESYEIMLCIGMLASVLVDAGLQHLAEGNWRWMVRPAPCMPALMWHVPLAPCPRHAASMPSCAGMQPVPAFACRQQCYDE